ncbi:nuclear transport factor 2 family protein [Nocardia sp. NPDC051929]|uniref:nuclear transport factor 2 family protein n=1 Tax=Nocardia sp. NPDC051929 TaxID=3364327 RepID=UPI0037CBE04E
MSTAGDTTAVTNLIMKYAELVDAGDFAGVGALFADGVFVGSGTTIRGREGVETSPSSRLSRTFPYNPWRQAATTTASNASTGSGDSWSAGFIFT